MESWAEALAMMTTTEPLLLRSEVKKEEAEIHHHHHDHGSHHLCGMEECSDSSLYSPTTTGLQLELEFGQDEEEEITDSGRVLLGGALINVGGSGGSYGSTMSPPSIAPSPDDEFLHTTDDFSPTPLDLLEADHHLPINSILIRKRVNSVLSSSSSSSSSSTTSSSGRNKKLIQQEQNGAGSVNQGTARTAAAEETDVSTISPLSSTGLCRSISRSYSSPEPDEGGIQAEGTTKTQLRQQPQQQQPTQQTQPQYVHCSSTTASVPGEFTSRHRTQSDFKDDDAPKRLCLVCGDVASGFHYGVASCEACKAFFKRTIQGNIEYNCPAANDCEINKRRRKACQACRFQKCIRMGMLKEGVRLDRVRGGRQKYRRVTPYSNSNNNNNSSNTTGAASTTPNASSATCNESTHPGPVKKISLEDNKILSTLGQCEPEMLTTADIMWPEGESSLANLEPALRILITLSELYDRELVAAIGWAKQIPGFLEMPLNDQMRLLQTSWPEVLSLSLAFRSIPINAAQPKLQWSADFCMNEKEARECGMEELFFQCVQIAQRLEQLSVTREEYYLLKALVLINCDVRVESMAHVKTLRETVLAALTDCSTVLRQGSGGSQHLQLLLLCMPCIRQVDSSLRRFWALIRRESRVPMNKLFLEMLESPMR